MNFLWNKKRPWQKNTLCQGRIKYLSAVPPWFTKTCACMDTDISVATDVCPHVAEYWEKRASLLTAPSAVHLPSSFWSGSQPPGLSVQSCMTLSPLQRFLDGSIISQYHIFVNKFSDFFVTFVHNAMLSTLSWQHRGNIFRRWRNVKVKIRHANFKFIIILQKLDEIGA